MTHGRRSLIAVLQRTSAREVAARCGVAPSTVSKWASGYAAPRWRMRVVIQLHYSITPRSWDSKFQPNG